LRISSYLTDEQLAAMTDAELDAWAEAQAIGPWTANVASPEAPAERVVAAMRHDVARELAAEAALRRQPLARCAGDLLLLGLRQAQAARRS
jgi:hypothetical protein